MRPPGSGVQLSGAAVVDLAAVLIGAVSGVLLGWSIVRLPPPPPPPQGVRSATALRVRPH
jgi:hypothetical protein